MNPVIENNHSYHAPTPEQVVVYNELREAYKQLAYTIERLCPAGRDLAVAHTNLQTSQFWANAAVARVGNKLCKRCEERPVGKDYKLCAACFTSNA